MNYPCYGDVTSLINAIQRRRSTTSGRSPLSHRSQYVLHAESSLESLRQELTKSRVDIASYQAQLHEGKEQTRDLQRQLKETQLQRQKALEEREMMTQVIGLYEMMTAIKIKCVSDFTTNAMAQQLLHQNTVDKERRPVCFECKAFNLQTKSSWGSFYFYYY
ncbi:hypothetical protein RFI_09155 [Reticulomyxa filosa]|uniref:Uncharacterized protein n=1 Tax=Reticulomyxa filosa TaxID=46433 RepID=X6NPP6_RETFI|nr:hypothetical protein RFI_09155 [Reticulomyxa filosa]|eukprot:ETO27976.1 hypothetical protein RFI_09155 [Reticulomyxa filosa]